MQLQQQNTLLLFKHVTYFAMYHFVLADARAVSQNLASSLHTKHFCASQTRSGSAESERAHDAQKCCCAPEMRKNALCLGGSPRFETQPRRNAAAGLEAVQKLSKLRSYLTLVSRWANGVPLWRQLEVASRSWRAGIVASARVSSADPWSGRARNAEVRRQQGGWEMNCRENTHGEVEKWGADSLHPLETRKQTFRSPSELYMLSTAKLKFFQQHCACWKGLICTRSLPSLSSAPRQKVSPYFDTRVLGTWIEIVFTCNAQ